ncbi:MAG: M28 family peptidase [Terriglobales bacterium]
MKVCSVVLVLALAACSRNQSANAENAPASQPGNSAQSTSAPAVHFNGQAALDYTKNVVDFGPRVVGSPGYLKTQAYLRSQLKGSEVEEDTWTQKTPVGSKRMTNFIAKFAGSKPGIVVVAGHYDTKPIPGFVGANDGGSSTGLPLELAKELHANGGKLPGYSVWVVWLDGEESIQVSNEMNNSNSTFGSQHLARKWKQDGTLKDVKAFILVDMIGDKDLDILRDTNSTPWLEDVIADAAARLGYQSHFFATTTAMDDDHLPFAREGVPVADLIDFTYGPNNADNSYWHTPQDTMDKLSAQSFTIVGDVVLEAIRTLSNPPTGRT